MARRWLLPALLTLSLFSAAAVVVVPGHAGVQPGDAGEKGRPTVGYRFSYSPIYQFDSDLDSGGSFDVQRHFLRFDMSRFIDRHWTVGLGLSVDYEH